MVIGMSVLRRLSWVVLGAFVAAGAEADAPRPRYGRAAGRCASGGLRRAEVRRWRPVLRDVTAFAPGMTSQVSPSRRVPCWQLGVASEAARARLARALAARGVPARAATIRVETIEPTAGPPDVALQLPGTRVRFSAPLGDVTPRRRRTCTARC